MTQCDENMTVRRKRLLYRATHRGMKEIDILLGCFAKARMAGLSSAQVDAFETLMEHTDPDLEKLLISTFCNEAEPAPGLIFEIKQFHLAKTQQTDL